MVPHTPRCRSRVGGKGPVQRSGLWRRSGRPESDRPVGPSSQERSFRGTTQQESVLDMVRGQVSAGGPTTFEDQGTPVAKAGKFCRESEAYGSAFSFVEKFNESVGICSKVRWTSIERAPARSRQTSLSIYLEPEQDEKGRELTHKPGHSRFKGVNPASQYI